MINYFAVDDNTVMYHLEGSYAGLSFVIPKGSVVLVWETDISIKYSINGKALTLLRGNIRKWKKIPEYIYEWKLKELYK